MIRNILAIISLSVVSIVNAYAPVQASQFKSDIFFYDDPINAKGLHVKLSGEGWRAEDIKENHIQFHQDLFANPTVMKGFADGQVRDRKATEERCYTSINARFKEGHPHGLLTVIDPKTEQPFMHIVGGLGDRKGTSEIAYAMLPEYMGKYVGKEYIGYKFGTKVVNTLVNVWAPEVRRIGLGIDLAPEAQQSIINAFRCFSGKDGTKELDQLDATASPSNIASWKILDKLNFLPANCALFSDRIIADYSLKALTGDTKEQYNLMEKDILQFFDNTSNREQLEPGKRYRMIDMENKLRTFSKHNNWNRIKYHFEKEVKTLRGE